MTKYLKQVFILLIVILLSQVVFSQKNQTINVPKSLNKQIENNQQDPLVIAEKILSDSQKNFDRTLTTLNIVVTGIGVLVALIAILVAIAIGFGFFQYRRWSKIRKDAEKNLKEIQEIKKKAEQELENHIKKIKEIPIENIPKEEMNANFIIDYSYDTLMELIRAKMFSEGFNSKSSHEAEVSYLKNLSFSESEIRFMDELRYNRNGIKYYGRIFEKEYGENVLKFMREIYPRLKHIVELNVK